MSATPLYETALLEAAYEHLDLYDGRLITPSESPGSSGADVESWTALGDWLQLAHRMGAHKVFFVGDDPVIVFTALPEEAPLHAWARAYQKAWCLARPPCLFLASANELRVYSLSHPPPASVSEFNRLKPIEIVRRVADVADSLARFHREQVESGEVFASKEFGPRSRRADRQLLADVNTAARKLVDLDLDPETAHALIERVLLIRYLEDRDVIRSNYFAEAAASVRSEQWMRLLNEPPSTPIINRPSRGFEAVLGDKEFTYGVFARLADDFNGDLFVALDDERVRVRQEHLSLIQDLLLGKTGPQEKLFLWAYDFSIVPTSLISSMYEQFYHSHQGDSTATGTHYTPPELVEYVVAAVLTPEVLATQPRILDPACGSGTFLVEAFRSIIRYETLQKGRRLSARELRSLLLTRIAGIDINSEAIRLTAFSLYLALLNYQQPHDILESGSLPPLICTSHNDFKGILFIGDAFSFAPGEVATGSEKSGGSLRLLPWASESFDVVIGNPPWDEPRGRTQADEWSTFFRLPVGDRNLSQLFIWRSLSLLRRGGIAGLLVATSVIANQREVSLEFRREWLATTRLKQIVNFSYARGLFFSKATAPFIFVQFAKLLAEDNWITYLTVRRTKELTTTGLLSYGRMERRLVRQFDLMARDYLWKTYSCGSHYDANLLAQLDLEKSLGEILQSIGSSPAYGWQRSERRPVGIIGTAPVLAVDRIVPWGPLNEAWLEPPPRGSKWATQEELYRGQRIVVARQARAGFGPYARLETSDFTYRHVAYGIPLQALSAWQAKVLFGVLLSSLGRYRLFMTSGRWGPWYDEVLSGDLRALPIRLTSEEDPLTRRVIRAVDAIRNVELANKPLGPLFEEGVPTNPIPALLRELDLSIFDLFDLSPEQRDLVDDFVTYGLAARTDKKPYDPDPVKLPRARTGTIRDIGELGRSGEHLSTYIAEFLARWNPELLPEGEFAWAVHRARTQPILAVVFSIQVRGSIPDSGNSTSDMKWETVLDRAENAIRRPVTRLLAIDGFVRAVTETEIIIMKRDESRLWTVSAAREDAEAALVRAMVLSER